MGIDLLTKHLDLTLEEAENLKRIKFYHAEIEPTLSNYSPSLEEIDSAEIIGTVNSAFIYDNFYEFYDSFHKAYLLKEDVFDNAKINPSHGDYPTVYEISGKYFFDEGRHRIIIAQIKKERIKVILYRANKEH